MRQIRYMEAVGRLGALTTNVEGSPSQINCRAAKLSNTYYNVWNEFYYIKESRLPHHKAATAQAATWSPHRHHRRSRCRRHGGEGRPKEWFKFDRA